MIELSTQIYLTSFLLLYSKTALGPGTPVLIYDPKGIRPEDSIGTDLVMQYNEPIIPVKDKYLLPEMEVNQETNETSAGCFRGASLHCTSIMVTESVCGGYRFPLRCTRNGQ